MSSKTSSKTSAKAEVKPPVDESHPLYKFCVTSVPSTVEKSEAELELRIVPLEALEKGTVLSKTYDLQKKQQLSPKTLIEDYHTALLFFYENDPLLRDLIDKGSLRGVVVVAKNVTIPVAVFDTFTRKIVRVAGKSEQYTLLKLYFLF